LTSEKLLAEVRARLAELSDPQFREGVVRFFKEPVDPYGVRAPEVRRIAAGAARQVKTWPLARRNHFCRELWRSGKLEEGGIAIEVYRRFRKQCAACEFHLFEKWIDRYVRNWAHTDGVSSWLLAASIENEPELIRLLPQWTTSRNRWKRRAAAVSLLQEAKKGRNTGAIFDLAERLIEDGDDLVQKGVGWLLKETYPKKPRETIRFLLGIGKRAPRLVLRIAAEKMSPADRKKIL
jgi:3-methyladenine DNA glycosylase AlkD